DPKIERCPSTIVCFDRAGVALVVICQQESLRNRDQHVIRAPDVVVAETCRPLLFRSEGDGAWSVKYQRMVASTGSWTVDDRHIQIKGFLRAVQASVVDDQTGWIDNHVG